MNITKTTRPFRQELTDLLENYAGRPSLLYYAEKDDQGSGRREDLPETEDLNHTGSHKINNVLGQVLLAKRWARRELLPRPAPDSTVSPPPRQQPSWTWSARSSHGKRGHRPAGAECVPYGAAGRQGTCGDQRTMTLEGRSQ